MDVHTPTLKHSHSTPDLTQISTFPLTHVDPLPYHQQQPEQTTDQTEPLHPGTGP